MLGITFERLMAYIGRSPKGANSENDMKSLTGIFTTILLSGFGLASLSTAAVAGGYYGERYGNYDYDRGRHERRWRGSNNQYYPRYRRYNPVVRSDYYSQDRYGWDGSYHSEDVTEDRRASYYSRGRNEAITRPRTTVESWRESPNRTVTRERTSWIGADGRPHSTTIDRETTVDRWGDTHTDTHVMLKKKPGENKKAD